MINENQKTKLMNKELILKEMEERDYQEYLNNNLNEFLKEEMSIDEDIEKVKELKERIRGRIWYN